MMASTRKGARMPKHYVGPGAQEGKAWGRDGEHGVQAVERRVLASDQAPAEGSTEGGGGAPAAGAGAGAAKLGPPCSNSPAAPPPKPAGHRLPLVRVLMEAPFTDDWTLEPVAFILSECRPRTQPGGRLRMNPRFEQLQYDSKYDTVLVRSAGTP